MGHYFKQHSTLYVAILTSLEMEWVSARTLTRECSAPATDRRAALSDSEDWMRNGFHCPAINSCKRSSSLLSLSFIHVARATERQTKDKLIGEHISPTRPGACKLADLGIESLVCAAASHRCPRRVTMSGSDGVSNAMPPGIVDVVDDKFPPPIEQRIDEVPDAIDALPTLDDVATTPQEHESRDVAIAAPDPEPRELSLKNDEGKETPLSLQMTAPESNSLTTTTSPSPSPTRTPGAQPPSQSATPLDAILALTDRTANEVPVFEPLRGQWRYGQAIFARYKKTAFFYSGNIATYLGAGLFMVVFDDGSLNYRVRRDDIVVRTLPPPVRRRREGDGDDDGIDDLDDANGRDEDDLGELVGDSTSWYHSEVQLRDKPMLVDFSVSPPRQISAGRAAYDVEDDAVMDMKHLECGVAYEDDSTQVSDSDDSTEEDMNMTPWQQMTQTFGMGPRVLKRRASRRSSISSLSQMERLSMNGKSMNNILSSPKSIKQMVQDYLAKKTKKVQPSSVSADPVGDFLRKMELRKTELEALQNRRNSGAGESARSSFSAPPSRTSTFVRSSSTKQIPFVQRSPSSAQLPLSSSSSSSAHANASNTQRVVYTRESDGVRVYGHIKSRLPSGEYEVVAEGDQTITVQVLPAKDLDFLPSLKELDAQIDDLRQRHKVFYAGRKVNVNLYPGTRFSGPGVITLEDDQRPGLFHVLLQNRIRLVNVPGDKIVPMKEKKRDVVEITDDQYLICQGKTKVHIGDQVFVRCEGEYEGQIEEKLGVLNGVYSNKTAAIDFADGSTGYNVSPQLITKRKRPVHHEDMDLLSLKNAVLMQGSGGDHVEVGYQVKADHPRRASVESCVVIRKHSSSACDVRFPDGTIAFNVFPSQMIIDKDAALQDEPPKLYEAAVGEYVLAWSSRFGRFCSAKVADRTSEGVNALYTVVFDYGEMKDKIQANKIAPLDEPDALSPTQKLTNYSIDTIGFEIMPVTFTVGEAVMARVHDSVQYYNGWVEAVREKERLCTVVFDSSERDDSVKFSAMFSVDVRNRFKSVSQPSASSSSGTHSPFKLPPAIEESTELGSQRRRRHSASSVGSMIMSVAGSIFKAKKEVERIERRGSHLITEVGAHIKRLPDDEPKDWGAQ
ncbi:hypothetical protein PINS_up008048 [Pythium insidiosum]|nr:hypothetical protein PINS_up008048 [Pythium insidiosum]